MAGSPWAAWTLTTGTPSGPPPWGSGREEGCVCLCPLVPCASKAQGQAVEGTPGARIWSRVWPPAAAQACPLNFLATSHFTLVLYVFLGS